MRKFKNRNDLLGLGLLKLLLGYLIILSLMFGFRVFFTLYFGDSEVLNKYQPDFIQAYYMGWKYDTLVISFLLAPVYIGILLGSLLNSITIINFKYFFYRIYFWLLLIVIPVLLTADMGFYSYFQDHINILFFGVLEDDTQALLETITKNYPYKVFVGAFIIYLLLAAKICSKLFKKEKVRGSYLKKGGLLYSLIIGFSFVLFAGAIRGGYGDLVLSPKYSDFSESEFINQIALNGIVTFEKSIKLRRSRDRDDFSMSKVMGYGNEIHNAFSDYLGVDVSVTPKKDLIKLITRRTPVNFVLEEKKPNVIVFVMESFGASWNQYNTEKFNFLGHLKTHFNNDIYFDNFISSDNGTIGSLLTITTNIPNRPGTRFLSESKFLQLPLRSSSNIPFQANGYNTNLLYGGKLGWRDIGKYFKYQGFDNVVGENGISKELKLSGKQGTEWGLYDEHLFDYVFNKISKSKRPEFIVALSTSNHPPFEIPHDFENEDLIIPDRLQKKIKREKGLFIDRFRAFQYSNYKLADFISRVKNSSLASNTIIAVTGDHNFWGFMNYEKDEVFIKHKVPFYIYVPKKYFSAKYDNQKVGSHEDIMTTLYNISLSDTEYISFGENLLSNVKSYALNSRLYAGREGLVVSDQDYNWTDIPYVAKKKSIKLMQELRKVFRSTMTISDFFVKEEARISKEK